MRYITFIVFLFILLFTGCVKERGSGPACDGFREASVLPLPDGEELLILDVSDELCPCDALCVWEGQFVLTVQRLSGDFSLDTITLPAYPLADWNEVSIYDFPLSVYEHTGGDCGGQVPEEEICFSIAF